MLGCVYGGGVRTAVLVLWAVGVALAGGTAVVAAVRVGTAATLPYVGAATVLTALLVGVACRMRWALIVSLVLLGAQIFGSLGAAWELATGTSGLKRDELERLGADPTVALAFNLAYSLAGSAVFAWAGWRYAQCRRHG